MNPADSDKRRLTRTAARQFAFHATTNKLESRVIHFLPGPQSLSGLQEMDSYSSVGGRMDVDDDQTPTNEVNPLAASGAHGDEGASGGTAHFAPAPSQSLSDFLVNLEDYSPTVRTL